MSNTTRKETLQPDDADFVLGLDLGQSSDYTALAVLERRRELAPGASSRAVNRFAVRHLKRWQLKTPYTQIVTDLATVVNAIPQTYPLLAVDQTGVGKAVVDMLRQSQARGELIAAVKPIVITGGFGVKAGEDGALHVPKKELVGTLQTLLQSRRLQIADLPERELLVKELLAFKVKITAAGNESFEAWRERDHDDMVLAVAMACWLGERGVRLEAPSFAPAPPPAPSKGTRRLSEMARGNRGRLFPRR